jgi:hypothetical protein
VVVRVAVGRWSLVTLACLIICSVCPSLASELGDSEWMHGDCADCTTSTHIHRNDLRHFAKHN